MEGIQKNSVGSRKATFAISDEEINYVMKIVTSLEDSCLLIKVNTKTIEHKAKQ